MARGEIDDTGTVFCSSSYRKSGDKMFKIYLFKMNLRLFTNTSSVLYLGETSTLLFHSHNFDFQLVGDLIKTHVSPSTCHIRNYTHQVVIKLPT